MDLKYLDKMRIGLVLLVVLCTTTTWARADPEAQAEPVPEAEPQAEPQMVYSSNTRPAYNPMLPGRTNEVDQMLPGRTWNGGQSGSSCGMADQCCGIGNQNCCFGGQKTMTKWERVCNQQVPQQQCTMQFKQHCEDISMPVCKIESEIREFQFQAEQCVPKQVRKCFPYERRTCGTSTFNEQRQVDWINDELERVGESPQQKCWEQTTQQCTHNTTTEYREIEVPQTTYVMTTRQQCRQVRVPVSAGSTCQTYSRIRYVPGGCPLQQQQTPCSQQGGGCPLTRPNMCGRTVPQRVVQPVNCGGWRLQTMCSNVTVPVPQTKMIKKMQSIPKYTPDCKEVTENKCHNFTIPEFQVLQRQESQTISVSLPRCQPTVEMAEFCTNLPMGDVHCRNNTLTKKFRVNKIVCTQGATKKYCVNIPNTVCRQGPPGLSCQMVPKTVEIPSEGCSNSATCNSCYDFYQNNNYQQGAGGCPSNTCDNWIDFNNYTDIGFNDWRFDTRMSGNGSIEPIPTINPSPMVPGEEVPPMFGWSGEGGTFNQDNGGERPPFNQQGSWPDNSGMAWQPTNWYPPQQQQPQGATGQTFYPGGGYWNGGGQGGMYYPGRDSGAARPFYPANNQGEQGGTWVDEQDQQGGGTFVPAVRGDPYSPPQNKI